MRILSRLTFLTLLLTTLAIGETTQATIYYVDRVMPGNDSNPGTEALPFLTIQRCLDRMTTAGNTCYVKNGTYPELVWIKYSGAPGAPNVLSAYPGHRPLIAFANPVSNTSRVLIANPSSQVISVSYITITGLEIVNAANGIQFTNADNLILRNNYIHETNGQGILGDCYLCTIEQNRIRNAGSLNTDQTSNQYHGMYLTGQGWVIKNNLIWQALGYGIQAAGYPYDATVMASVNHSGFTGLITNNTIAYSKIRSAIVLWQTGANNVRISNNILYENAQSRSSADPQGIEFYYSGGNNVVQNNLFYASGTGGAVAIFDSKSGASYTQSGNLLQTDPKFKDPSSHDFRLLEGSPATDSGRTESHVTVDFLGVPRPQASAFDIGAYESGLQSGAAPAPPRNLQVN